MTYDKYMLMCEQLGEEPDPDKIPPEIQDFPSDVQKAVVVYNKLGDRIFPDIGYLGKDFTPLPLHIEIMNIGSKEIFFETLLRLDEKVIKKSAEAIKAQRKEAERKAKKA